MQTSRHISPVRSTFKEIHDVIRKCLAEGIKYHSLPALQHNKISPPLHLVEVTHYPWFLCPFLPSWSLLDDVVQYPQITVKMTHRKKHECIKRGPWSSVPGSGVLYKLGASVLNWPIWVEWSAPFGRSTGLHPSSLSLCFHLLCLLNSFFSLSLVLSSVSLIIISV